jgi:hypothetical protein
VIRIAMFVRRVFRDTSPLWQECYRRGPWLVRLALAHALALAALLLLAAVDERQLTGVNIWLKPAKFALSISIYLLTMAWLLGHLAGPRILVRAIALVVAVSMTIEQVLITLQAARGTTSHYNAATPFDSAVFSLMGFGVAANSAAVAVTLGLFCLQRHAGALGYWWGIRLGLAIFLLGSVQGFAMIANAGHTVGAPDGGPGMPVTGWSTVAGDLRIGHFIGIHAIQILPAAGLVIDRLIDSPSRRWVAIVAVAIGYAGIGLHAFISAMNARPWLTL